LARPWPTPFHTIIPRDGHPKSIIPLHPARYAI